MKNIFLIAIGLRLSAECVPVSTDKILARDFALAIPEFQQADPLQVIGYAPVSGTQRSFTSREIAAWALRLHVPYESQDLRKVCFARALRTLSPEEIQTAMQASLEGRGAQIEVLDFSRTNLPEGKAEFPIHGAAVGSSEGPAVPILWRGRILTEAGRSFPIWAKVKVSLETKQITAVVALSRGQVIQANQVSITAVTSSQLALAPLPSMATVVGRVVKRDIAQGQSIPAAALEEPRLVLPGESVHVEAQSGQAQISFDAKAKTGGRRGDSITMQNPLNGRTFQAVILEKGRVQAKASSN